MSKAAFRIGLSGHQHLGHEATVQFVSQQLRDLLATYRQMARDKGQEIVAALRWHWGLINFSSKRHRSWVFR